MSQEDAIQLLTLERAGLQGYTVVPILGDEEIVILWEDIPLEQVEDCKEYLRKSTLVSNGIKERAYVDDFKIEEVEFSGRWRNAKVWSEYIPGVAGKVYIALRRGYAEEIKWDEAILVDPAGYNASGESLVVQFRNVSEKKLRELTQTLTSDIEDPKINEETYTGTWYPTRVIGQQRNDDGSGVILVWMSTNPKQAEAVTSVDASHIATTNYRWRISKSEMDTFKLAYATDSKGYTRTFRIINRHEDDGTYDCFGTESIRQQQTVSEYTSTQDASGSTTEEKELGTSDATDLDIDDEETGKAKRRRIERLSDDTSNITRTIEEVTDQTSSDYVEDASQSVSVDKHSAGDAISEPSQEAGKVVEVSNEPTRFKDKYRTAQREITPKNQTHNIYREDAAESVEEEVNTNADTALEQPSQEDGKIVEKRSFENRFQKYETHSRETTSKDQIATIAEDRGDKTIDVTEHTNADAALSDPTSTDGKIQRNLSRANRFNKYFTVAQIDTAKNQTATNYEDDASQSTEESLNTQAESALSEPTSEVGKIKKRVSVPTGYPGRYRTLDRTIEVKNQSASSYEDNAAFSRERSLETEADAPLGSASAGSGTQVRNENLPTRAGKTRTVQETVTAKNQSGSRYEESASGRVEESFETQADAPETDPGTQSEGTKKVVENVPTPFNKTRTRVTEITERDQESNSYVEQGSRRIEIEDHTAEDDALTQPSELAGYIYRHHNAKTALGKNKTRKETITAKEQTLSQFTSADTDMYSETTEGVNNADSIPNASAGTNEDVFVKGDINEFDKYDYRKIIRTAQKPFSGQESWYVVGNYYTSSVQTYSTTQKKYYVSQSIVYRERYYHYYQFFNDASSAASYVNGGHRGSMPIKFGSHLWLGHKVVRSDMFIASYFHTEPGT